jgi:hypothetical protein
MPGRPGAIHEIVNPGIVPRESNGGISAKASTFAGRRILIERLPFDPHRAGVFS